MAEGGRGRKYFGWWHSKISWGWGGKKNLGVSSQYFFRVGVTKYFGRWVTKIYLATKSPKYFWLCHPKRFCYPPQKNWHTIQFFFAIPPQFFCYVTPKSFAIPAPKFFATTSWKKFATHCKIFVIPAPKCFAPYSHFFLATQPPTQKFSHYTQKLFTTPSSKYIAMAPSQKDFPTHHQKFGTHPKFFCYPPQNILLSYP